ncbi:MAG: porin family protein, partial [Gemmatimonadota bacterium]
LRAVATAPAALTGRHGGGILRAAMYRARAVLVLATLLLGSTAARPAGAQEGRVQPVWLGFQVGYARADFKNVAASRTINGVLFGGFVGVRLAGPVSIQGEAVFVRKGGSLEVVADQADTLAGAVLDIELAYLEFPVSTRVYLTSPARKVRPVVYGGVTPAIRIGCELQLVLGDEPSRQSCDSSGLTELRGLDFGALAGAGIEIRLGDSTMRIEGRADLGTTNIVRSGAEADRTRNQQFTLLVGFTM